MACHGLTQVVNIAWALDCLAWSSSEGFRQLLQRFQEVQGPLDAARRLAR